MYKQLTRFRILVELASPPAWCQESFKKLLCQVQTSEALPYTRGTRIHRLLGVWNYLNNNFAMYKRLTRSRIRVELVSPVYLGLGIN